MRTQESHESRNANAGPSDRESHPHVAFLDEQDSINLQRQEKNEQQSALPYTISADIVGNRRFLTRQGRYTFFLILIIMVLRVLPSPLIITSTSNDPSVFVEEPCPDNAVECSEVQEGYESIVIKKLNPLQRQLKYFVKLNIEKLSELSQYYDLSKTELDEQITWIDIYASRKGEIYGQVLYQKDGEDIYQILFDGQPLVFIGEVHILSEQSYIIRIYKRIKKVKITQRLLQLDSNATIPVDQKKTTEGQQPIQQTNSSLPLADKSLPANESSSQANSNSSQQQQQASNSTQQSNNRTDIKDSNTADSQKQGQKGEEEKPVVPAVPEAKTIGLSVPLIVEMVRYSEFYTIMQLAIRYVTFLFALYVRGETSKSPVIFHVILLLVANPLIFIEIAFPNSVSNTISNLCSSAYITYLAVFLFYTRRRLKNRNADMILTTAKALTFTTLFVVNVMRQMHLVNQAKIEVLQAILMILVLLPLAQHLWKLFFVRSKTIVHRSMLFISLTCYYLTLLFLTGYLVPYGWKKIIFYLIIQTYGVELCYLTSPAPQIANDNPRELISQDKQEHQPNQEPVMHSHPNVLPEQEHREKEQNQSQQADQPFVRIQ